MKQGAAIGLLAGGLACFMTTWFSLALGGGELIRFNGIELALGTRFSNSSPAALLGNVEPQFAAQVAALCGLAALLLCMPRRRLAAFAATAAATGALAGLLALRVLFPALIRVRVSSGIEIKTQIGYYLAVVLFFAGAICAAPAGKSGN